LQNIYERLNLQRKERKGFWEEKRRESDLTKAIHESTLDIYKPSLVPHIALHIFIVHQEPTCPRNNIPLN